MPWSEVNRTEERARSVLDALAGPSGLEVQGKPGGDGVSASAALTSAMTQEGMILV